MTIRFLLSLILFIPITLKATVWQVGPTRTHTKPSQVAGLVANGDTVAIDAGVYASDVCTWHASGLLLKGVGTSYAKLDAQGNSAGGKAIWVIAGDNTIVENIEFTGCAVADLNGAGIRQEGVNLTIRHCYFHDNEEGILAGDKAGSQILIEYTIFDHNGHGDGYSHNLYINHVAKLTFRYNWTHRAVVGHELKSRAYFNEIYCNRISNEDGNASREIDLPNGGIAWLVGNIIQQGPNSENSNIIGFGMEGLSNPGPQQIFLINNTIWNQKSSGSFLSFPSSALLCKLQNNLFLGAGSLFNGNIVPIPMDSTANLRLLNIADAKLTDPNNYDFRPLCTSPAIDAGMDAGPLDTMPLPPTQSYLHPAGSSARMILGSGIDIGAYESLCASSTQALEKPGYLHQTATRIFLSDEVSDASLEVYDFSGKLMVKKAREVERSSWPDAIYLVVLRVRDEVTWAGKW